MSQKCGSGEINLTAASAKFKSKSEQILSLRSVYGVFQAVFRKDRRARQR
ncbi:hypothetical protein [Campylobacter showae]